MSKQAICPECNKPCGPYRPGAKVYHWSCLKAKVKGSMDKIDRIIEEPGETHTLLMTCPRCKRLVSELDETYLCPWCVSLEEEC